MNPQLEIRLRKCSSLPTLSGVAIEVLQRCQDEDFDFNEIARVIGRDPALTIKVLKMANSPMFALRQEVRSITQALGILGLNSVRTLVLSFSLVRTSAQERHGALASFWKRSVISSIAARELCASENAVRQEEAYLAGLLQDVGIMAMARACGAEYEALYEQADLTHDGLRAVEAQTFGADHAEVGAWLLERWGVPSRLIRLVKYSHDSRQLMGDEPAMFFLARCVEYSGRLADLWASSDPDVAIRLAESEATSLFGEGRVDISAVSTRIMTSVAAVAPMFELKVDDEEMAAVLDLAQEVMASSVVRLEAATESLRTAAKRDALTGLYNRGSLDAYLRQRFGGANLARLGILFADIDHFKRINDTYGHAAGDAILRSVSQRLTAQARAGDFIGRYGGEEFILVLDLPNPDEIVAIAERVRVAIEHPTHSAGNENMLAVSISIGCATAVPGKHSDYTDLIEEADQALYAAKRAGRNRVVRAGMFEPAPIPASASV